MQTVAFVDSNGFPAAAGGAGKVPRSSGKGRAMGGKAKAGAPRPKVGLASAGTASAGRIGGANGGGSAEHPRLQIANALTAILLHAEVVRRQADGAAVADADLALSSRHIAENARRLWRALGELDGYGAGGTDGPHR